MDWERVLLLISISIREGEMPILSAVAGGIPKANALIRPKAIFLDL
ncbi:hypothetical protein COO91_02639 [Nostoc flagelliforme CCNUN1]|uniref:Uncharacterized protein n=1 Tax=Nostoc flagelliforme CCNUN1 TaxID=2038116 RepID=A0A2K8SML8_9NOSO|nr:hypothetical protein COO91_02639 [Nostoc flagelliforme CCNUN1]